MAADSKVLISNLVYGNQGYSNWSWSAQIPTKSSYRDWGVTPNFKKNRKLSALKRLPFVTAATPYTHKQFLFKLNLCQSVLKFTANPALTPLYDYGYYAVPATDDPVLPTSEHTDLYSKCLQKLPKRMNGEQFNLPLFLAEAHKSIEMIADAARDIAKILGGAKTNREMHNLWLEYRYGWRLLVKDIYDGLVKIHDLRRAGVVNRVKVQSVLEQNGHFTRLNTGFTRYSVPNVLCDAEEYWSGTWKTTVGFSYRDACGMNFGTLQSLGITNPFLLSWELIPYSFVVDWFLPVGDYLQTLDLFLGKVFQTGYISYEREIRRELRPFNFRPNTAGWSIVYLSTPASQSVSRHYKRVPLTAFPAANIPDFRFDLNFSRAIDAISLMSQRLIPRSH